MWCVDLYRLKVIFQSSLVFSFKETWPHFLVIGFKKSEIHDVNNYLMTDDNKWA